MTALVPFFDGHNDFLLRLMKSPAPREETWLGATGAGHLGLARVKASGFAGGLFAIFVPPASSGLPPDFEALMADPPYALPTPMFHAEAQTDALAMAGLLHWMARAALASGAIAGVMHMEGAEAIGPDFDALYLFNEMGLRSLGPVWSRPTIFGHGVPMAFPGRPDTGPGLTERGRDLVRLCDDLGILIDLSHLNERGCDDVAEVSAAPLVATHSNAHALCDSPRNLTDRQLHMIRERGGMVGFSFATFYLNADGTAASDTGRDVMLRHLDHLIEQAGEDHVGLGSDFDRCVLPDLIGDVTGLPLFFEAMAAHGYDDARIARLARETCLPASRAA